MIECMLGNSVVVHLDVVVERGLQLGRRGESGLADHLADSAVEAFHHGVGLRVARWAQAVLDVQGFAAHVELVSARWRVLFADESVRELAAVVGQQLGDLHRCILVQLLQEVHAAGVALIGVDAHEHPARGAVDADEKYRLTASSGICGWYLMAMCKKPGSKSLNVLTGASASAAFARECACNSRSLAAQ